MYVFSLLSHVPYTLTYGCLGIFWGIAFPVHYQTFEMRLRLHITTPVFVLSLHANHIPVGIAPGTGGYIMMELSTKGHDSGTLRFFVVVVGVVVVVVVFVILPRQQMEEPSSSFDIVMLLMSFSVAHTYVQVYNLCFFYNFLQVFNMKN